VRTVEIAPTFEAWQAAARSLLADGVSPADVTWREGAGSAGALEAPPPGGARVPRQFLELARDAAATSDPTRWQALYTVLFRLVHEGRGLLASPSDPDVRRLNTLAAQGRRPPTGAEPFVPRGVSLAELQAAGPRCQGCELYRHATQMVFGRGPADARIVLVGEQPGDQEDLRGAPFVGPAGEVLDRALAEVGIDRQRIYVTNAVKHFSFVQRGKRRIHQTPRASELAACRPWLEAELEVIKPVVLGALGATAARAIFGPEFRLLRQRGEFLATRWSAKTMATLHPSAVLRGQDDAEQARLYAMLRDDLQLIARAQRAPNSSP
jgi:uracil-DNA glycosylase family protein